jgi:CheY-like chemotaxis protein
MGAARYEEKGRRRERILIVDDNDDHAEIIHRALKRFCADSRIDRVNSGIEALRYLRHEGPYRRKPKPTLILLDLKMPRMDGHEVLSMIKADPNLREIPVFILTTSDAELDQLKAKDNQASRYLVKPIETDSFRRLIEQLKF